MCSEIDHLPDGRNAVSWAFGCLFACYIERMTVMKTGDFHVSRLVLTIEMLICFVPITWLGMAVIYVTMAGVMPVTIGLLNLSATVVGPVGLIIAFRMIVLQSTSQNKAVLGILFIPAVWTVLAFALLIKGGNGPPIEWWRELVLLALLPAAGIAHLIYLAVTREKFLTVI